MKNPTHAIVMRDGRVPAIIRMYKNGRIDAQLGDQKSSAWGPSLCGELSMGYIDAPMRYLFGHKEAEKLHGGKVVKL